MDRAPASSPWRWVPTLYFAQGIPYVAVMTLSVVLYKNLEVSNAAIALYTSGLYLPWVLKPLWSPWVDVRGTKRHWIVRLQVVLAAGLALVAVLLPGPWFWWGTLAVFWLLALSSATHDIAADGFYLLGLKTHQQAAFVGVRSTFYRLAMIAGQGGLVWLAGTLQAHWGDAARAWAWVFGGLAVSFALLALYHQWLLPRPAADRPAPREGDAWSTWWRVFAAFFRRRDIVVVLAFLLLYRFAEAQLLRLVPPFLLDPMDAGGLALTTQQVGLIYGTIGVIALTLGGLAGGLAIARYGLKRMLWPMLLAMSAPNAVFVVLAVAQPSELSVVAGLLAVEQLGYGFGFAAYLVYMMMVAEGDHRTAHYALCTGFMALGMMLPGMAAGWIQENVGYVNFFLWVCVATLPSFVAAAFVRIDPDFGRRSTGGA